MKQRVLVTLLIIGALYLSSLERFKHLERCPSGVESVSLVKVHDGDTVSLRTDKGKQRLRLADIQAPELGVAFSERAKDRLEQLIRRSSDLNLERLGEDRFGRVLGRLFSDCKESGQGDLGAELIKEGLAKRYPTRRDMYREELAQAKRARVGIWRGETFRRSCELRASRRSRDYLRAGCAGFEGRDPLSSGTLCIPDLNAARRMGYKLAASCRN